MSHRGPLLTPTVSILIINYNYGRFLADAIDSALGQTYPHTEVVVVDDGSTDDSRAIIAGYGDRVRVVLKANGGQGSAFNAGFAVSTGDIVFFLDSDDCLMPEAVERVVEVWRPGLAKVHFRLREAGADGTPFKTCTPRVGEPLPSGDLAEAVATHGFYKTPPTSGNAFSRRALQAAMPLDAEIWPMWADMPLLYLAPFEGDIEAIQEPLGFYRRHGSNASTRELTHVESLVRVAGMYRLKDEMVAAAARRRGIAAPPGRNPLLRNILLLIRVNAPERYPPPSRSVAMLALDVAMTGWRLMPTLRKRVAFTGAIALIPLLPAPLAKQYVNRLLMR